MPKRVFEPLLITFAVFATAAAAHPGHEPDAADATVDAEGPEQLAAAMTAVVAPALALVGAQATAETGQAPFKFRVYGAGATLPSTLAQPLIKAHGGFAVDRRPGHGETYFALKGAGVLRISADLKRIDVAPTAKAMRDANLHNTTLWLGPGGTPYLSFPSNESAAVYTTDLDGKLLNTLGPPAMETITVPAVRQYFENGGPFVPTDVAYLNGRLYMTTGYSALDYVLVAQLDPGSSLRAHWTGLAFGGKGDAPDQFQTGHGITVPTDGASLVIADRPTALLKRFSPEGEYLGNFQLPEGSFPCDVDYEGDFAVVPCLHGPDRDKGAPIYLLRNGEIVSTIMIKEDLGLPRFQHIHNSVLRELGGRLYLVVQAWNPGDFVILEQVL